MNKIYSTKGQNLSPIRYWSVVGLMVLITHSSCQTRAKQEPTTPTSSDIVAAPQIPPQSWTYKITVQTQNTWGYDIYRNEQLIIHQPNIPALPGNTGFKTKDQAQNVALAVIEKIKAGEMPPSLSVEELQTLMK
ncbi:MAG: DUF4907 domain-containing protein [Saprospiraceae bacterium]|nr:DUF4907 domain-containing protein [Saprospiraceae bacterium]